ncbi:zinc finger [Paramuricea clavata]|uniref:TPA: zinc finger n=1 Tax=Paramuricea clavata TaxID=317549 RepID=A0A7D9L9J4_PARCT|nr:zinc finger [Paramuricea clavata]
MKIFSTDVPGDNDLTAIQTICNTLQRERISKVGYRGTAADWRDQRIEVSLLKPVVVVRKKDGTNRVCVDYPKLNRLTDFDPTPANTTEEIFEKMAHKKYQLEQWVLENSRSGERCS